MNKKRRVNKMAGVITAIGREKLCRAHAGEIPLPKIAKMAFGDGGIDQQGGVIAETGEETALRNELLAKAIDSYSFPIPTTCRYLAKLSKADLANQSISEQGLIDEEGDLIAYKTFLSKGKDSDMEFSFEMDEIF